MKRFLYRILKWSMLIIAVISDITSPGRTSMVDDIQARAKYDEEKWKKQDEKKRKQPELEAERAIARAAAELKAERAIAQAATPDAPPKDAAPKDTAAGDAPPTDAAPKDNAAE